MANWRDAATEVKEAIYRHVRDISMGDLYRFYRINVECRDIVLDDYYEGGYLVARNALYHEIMEASNRRNVQLDLATKRYRKDRTKESFEVFVFAVQTRLSARSKSKYPQHDLDQLWILAEAVNTLPPAYKQIIHDSRKFVISVSHDLSPVDKVLDERTKSCLEALRGLDFPIVLNIQYDDEGRFGDHTYPTIFPFLKGLDGVKLNKLVILDPPFPSGKELGPALIQCIPEHVPIKIVFPKFPDLWVSPRLRQSWNELLFQLRIRKGHVELEALASSILFTELLVVSVPRRDPSILTSAVGDSNAWVCTAWDERVEEDIRVITHWRQQDWGTEISPNTVQLASLTLRGSYPFLKSVLAMLRQQRHVADKMIWHCTETLDHRMCARLMLHMPRSSQLSLTAPGFTIATRWDYHGWEQAAVEKLARVALSGGIRTFIWGGDTIDCSRGSSGLEASLERIQNG